MAAIAPPFLVCLFSLTLLAAAKDNVALNGIVTAAPGWNSPSLANDGIVGTGESSTATCFHSSEAPGALPGWWRVDLGAVYPLDDVTIHFFFTQIAVDRSGGTAVYVQNSTGPKELCATIMESTLQNKTVSCPQTGQILELRKKESAPSQTIALCEVQVFVCASGTYGQNCALTCSPNCQTSPCDRVTGQCPGGLCNPGWTGAKCDQVCASGTYGQNCALTCSSNCQTSPCDHVTGQCPGGMCKSGWTGAKCDQACSAQRFGFSCNSSCGSCYENAVCDHVTGNCPRGCQAGWQAPQCLQECSDGTYGEGCTLTCGNCAGGVPCDKMDGTCTACQQGFTLPLCKAERGVTSAPSTSGSLSSQAAMGAGVGIGIGASVLVFVPVLLLTVMCVRRRASQNQGNGYHKDSRDRDDAHPDRSVYYNSAGPQAELGDKDQYESLEEETRDQSVPNAYEQIKIVSA